MIPFLSQVPPDELKGKRVLMRIDTNVPFGENGTLDAFEAFRLDRTLPSIQYCVNAGARVILLGHYGKDGRESLKPLVAYFQDKGFDCGFVPDVLHAEIPAMTESMKEGSLLLLENLRRSPHEEKNDPEFARTLASYGDLYVNEAFSVSHREHASIVGIPQYLPGFLGLHHAQEIEHMRKIREHFSESLFIIGGSKFDTKLTLIEQAREGGANIYIAGALAHPLYKARGYSIGQSVCDDTVVVESLLRDDHIMVPTSVCASMGTPMCQDKEPQSVLDHEIIVDIGEKALRDLEEHFRHHTYRYVLWNGPLGWYEKGFEAGSKHLAEILSRQSAYTVVGGGDTISLLQKYGLDTTCDFISTGGGALLDFMIHGTLPGIKVLEQ